MVVYSAGPTEGRNKLTAVPRVVLQVHVLGSDVSDPMSLHGGAKTLESGVRFSDWGLVKGDLPGLSLF